MNDLSVDIGYKSINHYGEYLCGDHVDVVQQENSDSKVVVLADGPQNYRRLPLSLLRLFRH